MRISDPAVLKGAFLATPINGLEKTNEFFSSPLVFWCNTVSLTLTMKIYKDNV